MAMNARHREGRHHHCGSLDKEGNRIKGELDKFSKPVTGDMIAQVGTISANNDETIGHIIAEAMKKVGKDGVITVEESKTLETQLEVVEGMQFDRGYLSPYFVTDPERMEAIQENAYILIHEKKISSMKDVLPLLEQISKSGKPLLIIAEDVEGEALATWSSHNCGARCGLRRKAPGFGDRRKAMLQDIAPYRWKGITEDLGTKLENVQMADLGQPRDHRRRGQTRLWSKAKASTPRSRPNKGIAAGREDHQRLRPREC